MRVLITGGAGFIGSHLADRFLAEGYAVRLLDNLETRVHPRGLPAYVPREAEFIRGDVADRTCLERALRGVDVVSHQAAYQDYMLDFGKFVRVNTFSTALLYEVIVGRHLPVRKIVIASSQAVYGEGQYRCAEHAGFLSGPRSDEQLARRRWEVVCPRCGREAVPELLDERFPNPSNAYAVSKLAGEKMALGLGRLHHIPTVVLRYSITQGPRQSLYNQYSGVSRIFARQALRRRPLTIFEDGLQTRDFVHVEDVVNANLLAIRNPQADFEIYNVGSGIPVTVRRYGELLQQSLGFRVEYRTAGEYRLGDNRHSVSHIRKLRQLGWAPQHDLAQILQDFLCWVEEIGGVPEGIPDAYADMQSQGVVRAADDTAPGESRHASPTILQRAG